MNIEFVYILPNVDGGVASVVRNLLYNSHYTEVKKKVLLIGTSKQNCSRISDSLCENIVVVTYHKWESLWSVYRKIRAHIKSNSIVISNDGSFEMPALRYMSLANPLVYILHGNCQHYYRILQRFHSDLSRTICVSSYLHNEIKKKYVDLDSQYVNYPINILEDNKTTKQNEVRIVYAGSVSYSKGCDLFPNFIEYLQEINVNYSFHIIGDGPLLPCLKNRLSEIKEVVFYGHIDNADVLSIMKECDVCVLFSKNEGLPVCLVEAMSLGVIPVAFDLPTGIHDIIINNVNGYIVEQGNFKAVGNIVQLLFNDKNTLNKMSQCAKADISKMFNPKMQTKKYEDIFLSAPMSDRKQSASIFEKLLLHLPFPIFQIIKNRFLNIS